MTTGVFGRIGMRGPEGALFGGSMMKTILTIAVCFALSATAWAAEMDMVTLSIPDVAADPGDRDIVIPILLNNESVTVRAVQLVVVYDPTLIEVVDFQKADRTSHLGVVVANVPSPGELRAVVMDFGAERIVPGTGTVAILLVNVFDSAPATATVLTFAMDGLTKIIGEDVQVFPLSIEEGTLYIGGVATAVGETGASDIPLADAVAQNFPNPFNADTEIEWEISTPGPVALRIYDVSGQLIRRLIDGWREAGSYSARWDGRDDSGSSVGTGIYVYQLERGGSAVTRKMLVLR